VIAEKYEVERVLGAGGMGVVVAARHLQLGQRVAIKFMRGEASLDPSAVSRFVREARSAVALSSEHITRVLDVGTLESGAPYIVMEYLDGLDLGAVLHRSSPFAIVDAVDAVLQACAALAEAHAVGIVHRDLKPANLFVTRRIDGTPLVKVLDFGISKLTERNAERQQQDLTASGAVMGSPGYMAPEQVRNAKTADARSDIWSLGVILYELLTQKNPFVGETIGETFARIVSESPPSIRSLRPEVPLVLADVIGQCLERTVTKRVQAVDELAVKLGPFGGEDAKGLVQRIGRIATGWRPSGGPGQETLMAPPESTANPPTIAAGETGTAGWLQSAGARPAQRPTYRLPWIVGVVGGGMTLAAVILGVRSGRAPSGVLGSASTGWIEPTLGVLSAGTSGSPSPPSTPAASAVGHPSAQVRPGDGPRTSRPGAPEATLPAAENTAPEPHRLATDGLPKGPAKAVSKTLNDAGAPAPYRPPTVPVSSKKSPYDDL
jgi:serine/threonine-protein kinase